MDRNEIRFATLIDNEKGLRHEDVPAFLQSNQWVKVRQGYDGSLVEIISQEEVIQFPKRDRVETEWGCLWLKFNAIRFSGPISGDNRVSALSWNIQTTENICYTASNDRNCCTTYENGFIPSTAWKVQDFQCRSWSLAPVNESGRRRGIIYACDITNTTDQKVTGKLVLRGPGRLSETGDVKLKHNQLHYTGQLTDSPGKSGSVEPSIQAHMIVYPFTGISASGMDDSPWLEWQIDLLPREKKTFAVSISLGRTKDEAIHEGKSLLQKSPADWVANTTTLVSEPIGRLSISGGEWWQEFFLNHIYQGNGALNTNSMGRVIGGTIAPDNFEDLIQEADIFHGMQIHNWVNPGLFKEFILFFYKYLTPPPAVKISLNTQPAVEAAILLEMYYRSTGDKSFFYDHQELYGQTQRIFERLLPYKAHDRWLFPAEEVSDGHPITKYDFCTNIRIWQAFKSAARIMREVYDQAGLGKLYAEIAEKIRSDIYDTMTATGPFGSQFTAGTNLPGTALFFDGEDNLGALAPYIGFCDFTDPLWRNYCRTSLSSHNATFEPVTGGQSWFDDPNIGEAWVPITSPWAAANIGSAMTKDEVFEELSRVERLCDVDTSFYWWPLPGQVRTRYYLVGHSLWMSGGVSTVILNHYLGINLDVPTKQLNFKPWLPWREYRWDGARLGSAQFNFWHLSGKSAHSSEISNHNQNAWDISFGFYIPNKKECRSIKINGTEYNGSIHQYPFYESVYLEIDPQPIGPGETIKVTAVLVDKK